MRAAGWVVSVAGAAVGLGVAAYALLVAEFAGGPDLSPGGERARMVLVGLAIVVVALALGSGLRRSRRWATYVFMALAALLGLGALWWTAGVLLG